MAAKTTGTKKKTASKPKTAPKKDTAPPPEPNPPIRRELAGAIFLFLGVLVIISYFSDEGSFIKEFSAYMKGLLGWGYHMLAPCFFVTAYNLIFHHGRPITMKVTAAMLIPVFFAAMLNMIIYVFPAQSSELTVIVGDLYEKGRSMDSGGVLGGLLGYGLESAFSAYAAFPLLFVGFVFFGFKALGMSISGTAGKIKERMTVPYDEESYTESVPAAQSVRRESVKKDAAVSAKPVSAPASGKRRSPIVDIPLGDDEEPLTLNELDDIRPADEKPAPRKAVARVRKKTVDVEIIPPEEPAPFSARSTADVAPMSFDDAMSYAGVDVGDGFREFPTVKKEKSAPAAVPVTAEISDPPKSKKVKAAEINAEAKSVEMAVSLAESSEDEYKFPPVELLRSGSGTDVDARDEIIVNKDRLEGAIKSFGINASIVGVIHGPTVTRYDIELEQGV